MNARVWTVKLVFSVAGFGISVWAFLIPYTKIRFQLDDATLGGILLAGGTGGVAAMPLAGLAIQRWGSRSCIVACGLVMGLMLPLLGIAPSPEIFTLLLFVYGVNFGLLDVAMNAQGAAIEARSGRLLMSGFHACYSIGTLLIALADSAFLKLGTPVLAICLVSAAMVLAGLTQSFRLLPKSADSPPVSRQFVWPNRRAVILGLCCYAAFMTEGACTDWSAIYLRFSRHMPIDEATLGFAAFAVMMSLARLTGDHLAMRFGQTSIMRLGALVSLLGFALAIFIPFGWVGVIGFGLVGFGTGNMAPLLFSAASHVPGMSVQHAMPVVVGIGYAGFLSGPVMIGFVSNRFGLESAFGLDAILLGLTLFASRSVAHP